MKKHNENGEMKLEKESTAAEEFMKRGRIDYIDEQFLDVIRGDTHKFFCSRIIFFHFQFSILIGFFHM